MFTQFVSNCAAETAANVKWQEYILFYMRNHRLYNISYMNEFFI